MRSFASAGFASIDDNYRAAVFADMIWVATWGENGLSLLSSGDGKKWHQSLPEEPLFETPESLVAFRDQLFLFVYGAVWKLE